MSTGQFLRVLSGSLAVAAIVALAPAAHAEPTVEVKAATKIEKFDPVDAADKFKKGDTVIVWTHIKDGAGVDLKHVWKKDGKDLFTASLPVKSKDWKTRSRREKIAPGSYTVEVQAAADGKKLGEVTFTVE